MKNLVTIQDKQVVTTSLAVADGCQLTHRDDLTPPQLKRLSAIVSENIWMMCRGISYADRKQRLTAKHQILLAV